MTKRTINIRTADGWSTATQTVKNNICPLCYAKLYVAPDGKTIYCDEIHCDHEYNAYGLNDPIYCTKCGKSGDM